MDHDRDAASLPSNSYIPQDRGLGRPVDRRQETYDPSPFAARKVLPHGDVSPDGQSAWPQPSMTSRVLTYGGAAVAAAAVTAGAVLAVRKVADLVTGNDELDRDADRAAEKARARVYDASRGRAAAPRFAGLSERERAAMRARAEARMADDERARARLRAEANRPFSDRPLNDRPDAGRPRRPRPPRPSSSLGFLGDIDHTAQSLTRNINGIVGAVGSALAAFRTVADQAEDVVREFHGTADRIRGFLDSPDRSAGRTTPRRDPAGFRRPARRDVVDLRDDQPLSADQSRTHRL